MKTTPIDERISAFADSELTEFETRRAAQEIINDDARRARWARHHAVGDLLRDQQVVAAGTTFADGVMARITAAEVVPDVAEAQPTNWLKPLVGLAIAASVAMVSVFSLKMLTRTTWPSGAVPVAQTESPAELTTKPPAIATPVAVKESVSLPVDTTVVQQSKASPLAPVIIDPNLNSYLSTHAEFAAQPALMPQVRVVGFDQDKDK